MAFSTTAIRYGWAALASLGVLTGATIYTLTTTRHQVQPQDIIELALGVTERCLATQTATNPTYSVTPPSFVRTWTSNVYTTNGVTIYTNIVTNTIGWHPDRAMMVDLDAKIFALVPCYVDTNTVYDGTTNICMLTVTGLFAGLQIGDCTNQFTSIPCWTNNPGTTNATTNAATFGLWAWNNYREAWRERYKVLNALKMTTANMEWSDKGETGMAWAVTSADPNYRDVEGTWEYAKAECITNGIQYGSYAYNWWETEHPYHYSYGRSSFVYSEDDYHSAACYSSYKYPKINIPTSVSNISASCSVYVYAYCPPHTRTTNEHYNLIYVWDWEWISNYKSNSWNLAEEFTELNGGILYGSKVGDNNIDFNFPAEPHTYYLSERIISATHRKGWQITDKKAILDWQFNYCTNKFW